MMGKILIVDDVEINREMLSLILEDDYETICFSDGEAVIDYLKTDYNNIAAMLLDIIMPGVDGYGVMQYINENELVNSFPILIISEESAPEVEAQFLNLGVRDFIKKPFDAAIVKRRVENVAELYQYKLNLENKVKQQTETLILQNEMLTEQSRLLKENNNRIIDILGTVVEYRNLESGEHINRVKGFTRILANKLAEKYPTSGLNSEKIELICAASALHDVGKIAISDAVLLKPGKLTAEEFEYMKSHTTRGCDIIQQIEGAWDDEYKKMCYDICRYHHERYDGKGYPDGLVGEEIPLAAQIVSVADVYDALISKRVYKSAFEKDKAFQMILDGECGAFSPRLLDCFKDTKTELEQLALAYSGKQVEEVF